MTTLSARLQNVENGTIGSLRRASGSGEVVSGQSGPMGPDPRYFHLYGDIRMQIQPSLVLNKTKQII